MAGLVPAIFLGIRSEDVDARVKPAELYRLPLS
jgi:hypothetical protein